MKAITRAKKALAEIIVASDDPIVDQIAANALSDLSDEDARTSSKKPTKR